MPIRKIRKICQVCGSTTTNTDGYCDKCRRYTRNRGTACNRGYDGLWRKVRLSKLAISPYCECNKCPIAQCENRGDLRIADTVHHIIPISKHPELRLSINNLMSVNTECHARIEAYNE